MQIIDFTHDHITEAQNLALQNYKEERSFVPALPEIDTIPDLSEFADNHMGVAAFEGNKMIGYLCSISPFERPFQIPDILGAYSPLHTHGAVIESRAKIYAMMYQSAAEKWVKAGATNHAITLYAHDIAAQTQFFNYGFGMRGVDAIHAIENHSIAHTEMDFTELSPMEFDDIWPLSEKLIDHFRQSPMFIRFKHSTKDEFWQINKQQNPRYFAVKDKGEIIAYIKISDNSETFISRNSSMKNICGAFCLPEYRGKGLYKNLLHYVENQLHQENYTLFGVDFESFNPTAYGFWLKHFDAYTCWVARRIDGVTI
ncbi:MAG TPA: GNAT family N-acetyltransferase [Ruminococcaceae bacterium]|mgnify:CR=1 FL=1|nr:GNAT family N-acetyltransferase [Oscillospiraceae bacterium]